MFRCEGPGPLQWYGLTESNQLDVEEQNNVLYIQRESCNMRQERGVYCRFEDG